MEKVDFMAITTIGKFIVGFIGIITTFVLLAKALVKKDNSELKKAGWIFLGTWVLLITLSAIEFLVFAKA